jgi:hypothetical protein
MHVRKVDRDLLVAETARADVGAIVGGLGDGLIVAH